MSHSLADMSAEVDTNSAPEGENATQVTEPVWPFRVRSYCAVSKSHNLMVQSSEADAVKLCMK
jgi:hypothetical protein